MHSLKCSVCACQRSHVLSSCPVAGREKKLAAKAQGRRHASSEDDDSEDGAGDEGGSEANGEQDPFFQHEDNPFEDPFFKVCKRRIGLVLLNMSRS